jgi:hypothetical protein
MSELFIHKKKRFAISTGILLLGVAFAGVIVNAIGSPQGKNAYLHEHLASFAAADLSNWETTDFDLPAQDKAQIEMTIKMAEGQREASELADLMTAQALDTAQWQNADCALGAEFCARTIRVNRRLTAQHVNKDYRVANIKETSVRVEFKTEKETGALKFEGAYNEARILRFYQTQGGWMHNASEEIVTNTADTSRRAGKFNARFSQEFTGLNYYPAAASWKDFWTNFPLAEIRSDLETAQGLSVNSVRIFLNHEYFNAAESQEDGLAKLAIFLDLCREKNINVLVTLFDLRPNYTLSNWAADIDHIDSILGVVGGHEAILGIDIKNQPDLDFENWGEGVVEGWLTVMAQHIQTSYPDLAVTAGWSKAQNAARLTDVFDVVTYHEYQNPKGFADRLKSVARAAGDKPVMITELGATVWKPPFITKLGEKSQASRLRRQLSQAAGVNGLYVWTLHDFDEVGREIVGPLPWRRAQQKHYGLMRPDGSERPAAHVLREHGLKQTLGASTAKLKFTQYKNK